MIHLVLAVLAHRHFVSPAQTACLLLQANARLRVPQEPSLQATRVLLVTPTVPLALVPHSTNVALAPPNALYSLMVAVSQRVASLNSLMAHRHPARLATQAAPVVPDLDLTIAWHALTLIRF